MLFKNICLSGILSVMLMLLSCNSVDNEDKTTVTPTDTSKSFGAFTLALMDGYTSMVGQINNGPNPEGIIWEKKDSVGNIYLLTPRVPFCENSCGGDAVCVEDDSCQKYPSILNAGTVTVNGIKAGDGSTSFTIAPSASLLYQPVNLAYPPFAEGDQVTVSSPGNGSVTAFNLGVKGIAPLVVLNNEIVMADGEQIVLQWTPPAVTGNSIISVKFDISHHGGTKGIIECVCPDNGSLAVPAVLLGKLKALGFAGYPKVDIVRRAVASSATAKVDLVLESSVTKQITIPGVESCSEPGESGECPDGKTCGDKYVCQ